MSPITRIFTSQLNPERLTLADEVAAIEAVKAGDDDAFTALVEAYAPRLRAAVGGARFSILDTEERQAVALAAFLEAVHETKPGERVASIVKFKMTNVFTAATAAAREGFTVPAGTAARFFNILNAAGGDHDAAAALAPSRGMSVETFWSIREAVGAMESVEARVEETTRSSGNRHTPDPSATPLATFEEPVDTAAAVEKALLSTQARDALDPLERQVVDLAFGFAEGEPVPDSETARRLGMNRASVWKVRQRALTKMQSALAA